MFIRIKNCLLNADDIAAVEARRELKVEFLNIRLRHDPTLLQIRCENEKEREVLFEQLARMLGEVSENPELP